MPAASSTAAEKRVCRGVMIRRRRSRARLTERLRLPESSDDFYEESDTTLIPVPNHPEAYLRFFFSRLASFFSLAVNRGFFFVSFLASCAFMMVQAWWFAATVADGMGMDLIRNFKRAIAMFRQ